MAGEKILTVSLPIFALIFSGYGAGRLRLLNEPAIVGLNGFVFYFALPALLFIKMAEAPLLEAWDWRFLAGYLTGGFAVFALAMLFGRVLFGHGLAVLGLQGLAAAWPNVGYMGLPLVITAFGEKATLPAVLIIVFDALVTLSIAIALVEAGLGRGGRWLDVRLPSEFDSYHLDDALNVPLYFIRLKVKTLDPKTPYVVVCDTGRRSSAAAFLLNERGFDAYCLRGGMLANKLGPD